MRWIETRSENLVGMVHGRGQRQTYKIGGTRDGRVLAYHLDIVQDCGAYHRLGAVPAQLTMLMAAASTTSRTRAPLPVGGDQHHADRRLPGRRAARGHRGAIERAMD